MPIVRKLGKPTLFVTFTCNPNWEEIQNELRDGQTAVDRPDVVSSFQTKTTAIAERNKVWHTW